jgi:hypothetical protein
VPPEHPLHGKGYDDANLDAHGGLTFAAACAGTICHVPEPGEPDELWWFGFDCSHAFDVSPGLRLALAEVMPDRPAWLPGETYRDLAFVRAETEGLAAQIASR